MDFFSQMIKIIERYHGVLWAGLGITLLLTLITVSSGVLLGTLLCFGRSSRFRALSFFCKALIDVIRGTPLLLQLTVFYFAFDNAASWLQIGKFASICLALSVNSAAYVAEIIRSGIQSVDRGQTEAALSLGLNQRQTMFKIILPQALRSILPALGNEFISVTKESSLASTFFAGDLMTAFRTISGTTFIYLPLLCVIGVIYFVLTFILSKAVSALEKHWQAI